MIEWVSAGLVELNHRLTVDDAVAPGTLNIFWDNFQPGDERLFSNNKLTFGMIATEIPSGNTFN
jgi:hypothetical protein